MKDGYHNLVDFFGKITCKNKRIMVIFNSVADRSDNHIWLHGQAVKTSPFHGGNTGSIPVGVICTKCNWIKGIFVQDIRQYADVAQLAEQLICNQQVIGSSPIIGFVPERDI